MKESVNSTVQFAVPLSRINGTVLQKITATHNGQLVLSVYKRNDDRSFVVLAMKRNESGFFCLAQKPPSLEKPNTIVQIARKYLQGKRVIAAYTLLSPVAIVLEFQGKEQEESQESEGPNCLILELDKAAHRIVVAKKYSCVPPRYFSQYHNAFLEGDVFFESWCEWNETQTKTKRRACFARPVTGCCPLPEQGKDEISVSRTEKNSDLPATRKTEDLFSLFPYHVRKSIRTKERFLARRLLRQQEDMPRLESIQQLEREAEGLKTNLYRWPKDQRQWAPPSQLVTDYGLQPHYILQQGEKPGHVLKKIFRQIEIFKRRMAVLANRIAESELAKEHFQFLISEGALELAEREQKRLLLGVTKENGFLTKETSPKLCALCDFLEIPLRENALEQKKQQEQRAETPFRSYLASTGEFIRVARSASDGDLMLKLIPSHHIWLHVLTGEGAHVWLEKPRSSVPSATALREAAILAVHHSKQSRAREADVQYARRADLDKRKHLPAGKVLVRRSDVFFVKYDDDELQAIKARKL